jgi:predicted Fe-Mo cluster-binding NifX family protein
MKIAFVTDDGTTISQHFGRAQFYEVLTVEGGKVVARERREKMGHAHFAGSHEEQHGTQVDERHGFGAEAEGRHAKMAAAIGDCQYLVVGGMGAGAYESMKQAGISPLVTDMTVIDEALKAQLAGTLKDHTEYLH